MILIRWIALSTLWTTVARTTNYMKTSSWELLSYAIQEYQALEACLLGPTIAVGFSELIVRLNLQFSVNSYLVTRLLIGMDLELFHFLFVTTKGAWFFSIGFKRYIKSHFSAYMWREKNTLKLVLSIMFLSFPISSVTSDLILPLPSHPLCSHFGWQSKASAKREGQVTCPEVHWKKKETCLPFTSANRSVKGHPTRI